MNGNANLKGALLMTASMGSFTLNDVFVKLLAEDMPLFQIVFLRSVLTVILMVIAAAALGQLRLRPGPGDGRAWPGGRRSRSPRWSRSSMR
jgi:S-adenosylmethionine uptake transporter